MQPAETGLSHIASTGEAVMVDVSEKPVTRRMAVAEGYVVMAPRTLELLLAGNLPKGEALNTARIAGILAAKKTGELIPLCHPLPLEHVQIDFEAQRPDRIRIEARASISAKTGIEMEALTAVAVAALTIVDMTKAVDKMLTITGVRVIEKTGGKSNLKRA